VYHRKNPTQTGPSDEWIVGNTVPPAIMGLTVKQKQSVVRESYQPSQRSGKKDKSEILDEVSQLTAYARNAANRRG
jgi:hypothetical protein